MITAKLNLLCLNGDIVIVRQKDVQLVQKAKGIVVGLTKYEGTIKDVLSSRPELDSQPCTEKKGNTLM